jgi:ectoine hydroxylase-related dioxygenase (phytanoyl-CoA dioxygenase family)
MSDSFASELRTPASQLAAALAHFEEHGYVILERVLDEARLDELQRALVPFEAQRPFGRNDFEGERTHRVYSLAGKGAVFMRLAEEPAVVNLLDRLLLPSWLLSNLQSIRLYPGETAQPWHTDDAFYGVPRPRGRLAVSTIWAIEDFTVENGATELVPGSHLWGRQRPEGHPSVHAVMPRGSVVLFDGALWHRGGANRAAATRLAISPQYCQPWLRTQESQLLIAPPEVARGYSDRARAMLGYSIHPPFLGQVDGMHPLRLVDPAYRQKKTSDHAVADRFLARPGSELVTDEAQRAGRDG